MNRPIVTLALRRCDSLAELRQSAGGFGANLVGVDLVFVRETAAGEYPAELKEVLP